MQNLQKILKYHNFWGRPPLIFFFFTAGRVPPRPPAFDAHVTDLRTATSSTTDQWSVISFYIFGKLKVSYRSYVSVFNSEVLM